VLADGSVKLVFPDVHSTSSVRSAVQHHLRILISQ
jgi:hypothetical protein